MNSRDDHSQMTLSIAAVERDTGIGKDTAFALSKRGHRILATTQTEAQAEALKQASQAQGLQLEVFKLDITVAQDRELLSQYAVDVLINNAGISRYPTVAATDQIALTRMSGSGATVFGLYPSDDAAQSAARALSAAHPTAWVKATQLSVQQR